MIPIVIMGAIAAIIFAVFVLGLTESWEVIALAIIAVIALAIYRGSI